MFPQPHWPVADWVYHSPATLRMKGQSWSAGTPMGIRWFWTCLVASSTSPPLTVTSIYARELTAGGGGGGGTDDQTAAEVTVDTTNFSSEPYCRLTIHTVQDALETIDSFSQYQGAWQQAAWPAGVIVTRSGIAYISLVNNNTEIPTPSSTQWSGLPEGFTYRGEAPILATNYNYGQVVYSTLDTKIYYYLHQHDLRVRLPVPTSRPMRISPR